MAEWQSLGTLNPDLDWQNFPQDVFGQTTLRVIHSWGSDRPIGCALLCQYIPTHGRANFRRIWAVDTEPKILILPIPPELEEASFFVYTPQIKLGRFPHMGIQNWQIELQVFV